MPFEALIDAISKEIRELSPNFSISGISPTILNLKRDLELLYKPRSRAFINATSHNIAKETESYHRALERL